MCITFVACSQSGSSSSDSTETTVSTDSNSSSENSGNAGTPDKPDGEAPDGQPGERPDGEGPGGNLPGGGGFGGGSSNADIDYTGNVKIVNTDSDNILFSVCADGWNGDTNTATVNASNQTLEGTILVGSDSKLTLNLTDGSSFTGLIGGYIYHIF